MSLLSPLLRFIDPIQFRKQQEELRRHREALPPDFEPEPIEDLPSLATIEAKQMQCRICNATGHGRFCLTCLAETMIELPTR